jgi:CRP-like cAMP-binding protein
MIRFIDFIQTVTEVPDDIREGFQRLVHPRHFRTGEFFVCAGDKSRAIGFLQRGLFRYFYVSSKGEEFTKGFFVDNGVLSAYSAILENRASYFTIEALEDSEVEVVNYDDFIALFNGHPSLSTFLVALLQKAYIIKEAREREFLLFDATQRYESFLRQYPGLDQRISQQVIASYLGIAPESLSRLRKKVQILT